MKRIKRLYLRAMKNTFNRITTWIARRGRGPFALIRHVGRRTGQSYETPVMLARVPDGFIAELTYGPSVDWYRNIEAAGGCTVLLRGREYVVDRVEPCSVEDGLRAYGSRLAPMLRLLRRQFRRLHVAEPAG